MKYNIVISSGHPGVLKIGGLEIEFDGKKLYGVKDIPQEVMASVRDEIVKEGMHFVYVDVFYGCFQTYEYVEKKTYNVRKRRSKKEVVEEVQEPVQEVVEEPVETPVEEVIEDEQPSESE